MLLAVPAAESGSGFTGFDVFMILFTLLIVIALVKLVKTEKKNWFAIGFTVIALLAFLVMDAYMIGTWFGLV